MKAAPRTWLITGGASGIGRELARQLARRGERLVLWDRDEGGLAKAASELGAALVASAVVDVVSPDSALEAAARLSALTPPVTRVVHCAGILRVGSALDDVTPADYRAMMEVNFLGSVHVARALVPLLARAGTPRARAQFAFVSSIAGLHGVPTLAGYSASKFAVVGFAQALRGELGDAPVDVRVICPPAVDTPMLRNLPALPPVYKLSPPQPVEKVVEALLVELERRGFLALLDVPSKLLWRLERALPGGLDRALAWASRK